MPETEVQIESKQPAVFDAGIFAIQNVSEKGFSVITRENKRRRDSGSPFPLTDNETETLAKEMQGEISFAQGKAKRIAEREGREPTPRDYVENMIPKSGIRNVVQENINGQDTLFFDTRPVTYVVYNELVTRGKTDPKLLDFGETLGTAAVIFTTDGKLIVQYRGKGNRAYGNVPGASAAGLMDGKFNKNDPAKSGTLIDIDPTANLRKEMTEELGIDADLADMKVIALAHDNIKPHSELILNATIPFTSQELAGNGLIPDDQEGHDFKERYFTIEGTPESIDTLLTDVKCPLPSTHAAAFFIAGFEKMAQQNGSEAAYTWARNLANRIKENYAEIDRIVQERYNEFPSQKAGKHERSRLGYDPDYLPEEQGLPSLLDELIRTKLISEEMYKKLKEKYG